MDESMDDLKRRFFEIADRFRRSRLDAEMPDGATTMEARALMALRSMQGEGVDVRSSALACAVHTSPSAISQTLRSLEGKGWVERRRSAGDSRAVQVELTELGAAVEARCRKKRAERMDAIFERIGEHDLRVMVDALERVVEAERKNPDEEGGDRPCAC